MWVMIVRMDDWGRIGKMSMHTFLLVLDFLLDLFSELGVGGLAFGGGHCIGLFGGVGCRGAEDGLVLEAMQCQS